MQVYLSVLFRRRRRLSQLGPEGRRHLDLGQPRQRATRFRNPAAVGSVRRRQLAPRRHQEGRTRGDQLSLRSTITSYRPRDLGSPTTIFQLKLIVMERRKERCSTIVPIDLEL